VSADQALLDAHIGVFDSGVGGLSILLALRQELPQEDFVYLADSAYAPYGERDEAIVRARALAITQALVQDPVRPIKALVVACNTATALAINELRAAFPELPIVGVEPAIKTALQHSTQGYIGVMATRGTLHSAKFQALLASQQERGTFTLQACDGLAQAIEHDDATQIRALCTQHLQAMGLSTKGQQSTEPTIDTVVLGCTHYPFARAVICELLGPGVTLIDNGAPVARQTRRLIAHCAATRQAGSITLLATGPTQDLASASQRWLQVQAPIETLNFDTGRSV
jgi:glutamate racemase